MCVERNQRRMLRLTDAAESIACRSVFRAVKRNPNVRAPSEFRKRLEDHLRRSTSIEFNDVLEFRWKGRDMFALEFYKLGFGES